MSSNPIRVTQGRFEIEQDHHIAFLEFDTDGQEWLTLWHTEVPPELRSRGLASELVKQAFNYATEQNLRVDVICPFAAQVVAKHPEYQALTSKKS